MKKNTYMIFHCTGILFLYVFFILSADAIEKKQIIYSSSNSRSSSLIQPEIKQNKSIKTDPFSLLKNKKTTAQRQQEHAASRKTNSKSSNHSSSYESQLPLFFNKNNSPPFEMGGKLLRDESKRISSDDFNAIDGLELNLKFKM